MAGRMPSDAAAPAGETVLLVHGLLRTPRSLATLARSLERAGYATRRFGYRSTRGGIADHAIALEALLVELASGDCTRLHLVGHSLGNLVARAALERFRHAKLGRVVMLVPPNRGSPVARWLAPWLGDFVPVLRELSDGPGSAVLALPARPDVPIGIIAARYDHLVPERSTHLAGERDHVRIAATHTSVLWNRRVQELVRAFLRDGRFQSA